VTGFISSIPVAVLPGKEHGLLSLQQTNQRKKLSNSLVFNMLLDLLNNNQKDIFIRLLF
jgi:hypothetical protein